MTIGEKLSALIERVDHVAAGVERVETRVERVETHTAATNGRVGRLERWRIAIDTETRVRAEARVATAERRSTRRSWIVPACTGSGVTILGVVLAHVLGG